MCRCLLSLLLLPWSWSVLAAELGPDLARAIKHSGSHADTAVIIRFVEPPELAALATGPRNTRDKRLMLALQALANKNRAAIQALLDAIQASEVKDLWLIHALAVTVPAIAIPQLLQHPGVQAVELDSFVRGGRSQRTPVSEPSSTPPQALPALGELAIRAEPVLPPQWNVLATHAPELWAQGFSGQGVVLATMDTGVDLAHPALVHKWRAGNNSWFDPHGEQATPYDALGHGTQATGVLLGGSGIGVAPDARWIAVRLFNHDGKASMSDIHRAFQWLLDPDGDPATLDAPDVVNASWALAGRAMGSCIREFETDVQMLQRAGIVVVFAAGNDGPMPSSSSSPANNRGVLSVGAADQDMTITRQTSRGPSSCDGSVFPKLLAPGQNIRTTDLSHGGQPSFSQVSGSSLAAPHVAGVMALLAGAFPAASVAELQAALLGDATDRPVSLNALTAFQNLCRSHPAQAACASATQP